MPCSLASSAPRPFLPHPLQYPGPPSLCHTYSLIILITCYERSFIIVYSRNNKWKRAQYANGLGWRKLFLYSLWRMFGWRCSVICWVTFKENCIAVVIAWGPMYFLFLSLKYSLSADVLHLIQWWTGRSMYCRGLSWGVHTIRCLIQIFGLHIVCLLNQHLIMNGQNHASTQLKLSVPNRCVLTCDGDYSQKCTDILHSMMKLKCSHDSSWHNSIIQDWDNTIYRSREKHKTLSLDDYYLQVKYRHLYVAVEDSV